MICRRAILANWGLDPALCPLGQGVGDVIEFIPLHRQLILDADRRFWVDNPPDDAFSLKFLQALGEQTVAESRNRVDDIGKPGRTHQQ